MSKYIITTKRLYLRKFHESDAFSLFRLNADPTVLQYTGDVPFTSEADALAFVRAYDHYEKYDFGRWAVVTKADNQFLGWCGLKYTPHLDEVDIGFRLMKSYWGKGYATEAGSACLTYGFKTYDLKMIVGRAMTANKASIKVLEKLGMSFWKSFDFDGRPGCYYRIYNEAAHPDE